MKNSVGPILGISCDYHDAAAAICVGGELIAAAQEERFSRIKNDSSLPINAIASCLAMTELKPDDIQYVAFHEKPLHVMSRFVMTQQRRGPLGLGSFAEHLPTLLRRNLFIGYRIHRAFSQLGASRPPKVAYGGHHMSHAAAAFFPSPFEQAAILVIDGVGEWSTVSIGRGAGNKIELIEELRFPHSLGLLYSLVTEFCGFRPNDGEYKLMGLAPFGSPSFVEELHELIAVQQTGAFSINARATRWWHSKGDGGPLPSLLGGEPLGSGEQVGQREADLAASMQAITESTMTELALRALDLSGEESLVLGGGVALNCVANAKVAEIGSLTSMWVPPAPGDAGSAAGAALWLWYQGGHERTVQADSMMGAALGPSFSCDEVASWLSSLSISYSEYPGDRAELAADVAQRLADGAIVGWFDGRMEFGPRALGHRSILADPRGPETRADINDRVKGREGFRPFAPAVLSEHASDWFDMVGSSPFMSRAVQVAEHRQVPVECEPERFVERLRVRRSEIGGCTHIDGSSRVQTVDSLQQPRFHQLIEAFYAISGCPVLLNTSFNVADEPIVCTPDQALRTAVKAGLDLLVLENLVIDLGRAAKL